MHAACKMEAWMIPSCAICTIALPVSKQCRSLNPASASNKTVVEYLATVSLELELANGSVYKTWFTKLEKAATYLATAENIHCNKWAVREVCLQFVKLDLVLNCYVITYNYAFCNLIRALNSGSCPTPFDKKARSEHQTCKSAVKWSNDSYGTFCISFGILAETSEWVHSCWET